MVESESDKISSSVPSEEFVQLFTKVQRPLYLFILSQCGNVQAAEEILQETNLVIWAKLDQFESGTNFDAWVRQIATYEVLKHRQRWARDKLKFSEEFLTAVSEEASESSVELELRRDALQLCLKKLSGKDRELIELRYQPGQSGQEMSKILGRPTNSISQSVGRIRHLLLECIQRQLAVT